MIPHGSDQYHRKPVERAFIDSWQTRWFELLLYEVRTSLKSRVSGFISLVPKISEQ